MDELAIGVLVVCFTFIGIILGILLYYIPIIIFIFIGMLIVCYILGFIFKRIFRIRL